MEISVTLMGRRLSFSVIPLKNETVTYTISTMDEPEKLAEYFRKHKTVITRELRNPK
jgi:hypothetical protein